MEKKEVKATIKLDGKSHEVWISKERAEQIRRLQKLIRENNMNKIRNKN